MSKPEMMLWLDDHRGQYIPRDFANSFTDRSKHVAGISDETWTILQAGPDHEWYWDEWSDVLNNAVVIDDNGVRYTLYQDGALWLVPEGMQWNDDSETFVWPESEPEYEHEDKLDPPGWEGGFADNH